MNFVALGADIELIAKDVDQIPRSVIGLIPGTKADPYPLPNGGSIQVDNVLPEFNIEPAFTSVEYVDNLAKAQLGVDSMLQAVELEGYYHASCYYPMEELTHPDAYIIGCNVDYNAYTVKANPKPRFDGSGLRTAAAHVHFSWKQEMTEKKKFFKQLHKDVSTIVRLADLYLGIPSLFIDKDQVRRSLYGKAGAYRVKVYNVKQGIVGGEYRTLSNWWSNPKYLGKYAKWIFNTMKFLVENKDEIPQPTENIQSIINSFDLIKAKAIMSKYNIEAP